MKIAYCIGCGNKFPNEALFCPYCGTKVYNPSDDNATPIIAPVATEEVLQDEVGLSDTVKDAVQTETVFNVLSESDKAEDSNEVTVQQIDDVKAVESSGADVSQPDQDEKPLTGVCIICACFPMIGFIAALCNIGSNKRKAKVYALCALGGFAFAFISGMLQAL